MKRFVEGTDRGQATLFPEYLEDWIYEDNPVRAIDAFVDKLGLAELGFEGMAPEVTGRPSYHPSVLLKLYIYGCLNRVQAGFSRAPNPLTSRSCSQPSSNWSSMPRSPECSASPCHPRCSPPPTR
jgi:hypothetical protein